jgi:tetratricopeptide (TPR) repeat protein
MKRVTARFAALIALSGCTEHPKAGGAETGRGGDAPEASPLPITKRTTRGDIALSNLDAHIEALEAALEDRSDESAYGQQLVDLYAARTRFTGSFGDFSEMQRIAERLVAGDASAEAYATRASVFLTVHEFDAARADLERAQALGFSAADTALFDIDVATGGEMDAALAHHRARAREFPSFQTLTKLATTEASVGDFWTADAHYVEAALLYRDVSPLALAWLAFARGVMWAEMANRPDYAEPLYREAVERIPSYIVANVHLAEIEAQRGDTSAALARLLPLADSTDDPEPSGFVAELLSATDPAAGAGDAARARERYEALLALYPLAFADHAAEFFAGPVGRDPGRGLELALENLENRPTPRAYIVALEAARASEQPAMACELARAAAPLRSRSVNLALLLDDITCD